MIDEYSQCLGCSDEDMFLHTCGNAGKSMSKHTPGPWEFGGASQQCYAFLKDDVGNYHPVQVVAMLGHGADPREETEANARLIAAAPELLAALEEAQTSLKQAGIQGRFMDRIAAAIAKANGEA